MADLILTYDDALAASGSHDPDAVWDRHLAHSHSGAGPPEVRPSREDETLAAGLHDVGGKRPP